VRVHVDELAPGRHERAHVQVPHALEGGRGGIQELIRHGAAS
jgi:hypothetical protein